MIPFLYTSATILLFFWYRFYIPAFLLRWRRCGSGWGSGCGFAAAGKLFVKIEDKLLEFRVPEGCAEFIILHFFIRPVCAPSILSHSVNRCHHSGAMLSTHAMNVNRLIGRIIH